MKRKHKIYSRPKRPFEKARIEEEVKIKEEFGLKNKREIWRAEAKIKDFREKAKKLISADSSEQQMLFEKLQKFGLKTNSIADVLALEKQDYLNRRLQTIVKNKGLAQTIKKARQMIVHKKIVVDKGIVDSPSYIVPKELEDKISVIKTKKKKKLETKEASEASPKETEKEESVKENPEEKKK